MLVELVKENLKIEFGVFYDLVWESVKNLEFYMLILKIEWKKCVELIENVIVKKLYLVEILDMLYYLYYNESLLGGWIYYYDRKNVLINVVFWDKLKEFGIVWLRSSREEILIFLFL